MKRMIDNKDYDNFKNSVSELGTKVNNIKDIKTITIESTQLVDATHAQLTDEQFEIIENNSYINVVLPTGQSIGFNRIIDALSNYHLAMCMGDSSEISFFTGDIDSTTKIVTLKMGDFSGGGTQEYTHNIIIRCNRDGYKASCGITIKSTSNTPFTKDTLISYLASEGHTDYTKCYTNCNGYMYTTQAYYVLGVFSENSRLYINGTTDGASINSQWFASANIEIIQEFVK